MTDKNGLPKPRCPMILGANGLAALFTEVVGGKYDGKPVMILNLRRVLPNGGDFKVGLSEEAVNSLIARCLAFKRYLACQREALEEEGT